MANKIELTGYNKLLPPERFLSPIIRPRTKNVIQKQKSCQNFNNTILTSGKDNVFDRKYICLNKCITFTGNLNNNKPQLSRCKSVTNCNKIIKKIQTEKLDVTPNDRAPVNTTKNNCLSQLYKKCGNSCKKRPNLSNSFNNEEEKGSEFIFDRYYCSNCFNRKLGIATNYIAKFKNPNKSFNDVDYQNNIELKLIDENYINNKIIENEKKQMKAFNYLSRQINKFKKTEKEKLQYINENYDNPLPGLNLQDYLYYNTKKIHESANKNMIDNIKLYQVNKPRKEIKDYYKNVQFQIPHLEKSNAPSAKYKINVAETLKKQINDKERTKNDMKKLERLKGKDENDRYNEFLYNLKMKENQNKIIKQKIMNENMKNLEAYQKFQDEVDKKDKMVGASDKFNEYKKNQTNYRYFLYSQKLNEINNLQNWIDENKRQNEKKLNFENKERKNWREYNNKYVKTYFDNTHAEQCVDCNMIYPIHRLYEIAKKK